MYAITEGVAKINGEIGDCVAGCGDCHIGHIFLIPEGITPEVHSKGTMRITPENLLKRDPDPCHHIPSAVKINFRESLFLPDP